MSYKYVYDDFYFYDMRMWRYEDNISTPTQNSMIM